MEFTHQQEASSSSSPQPVHQSSSASASTSSEPKALRSSARVKAAKEKEKDKERELADQVPVASDTSRTTRTNTQTNPSKRARVTSTSKGKGKEYSEDISPRSHKKARRITNPTTSTGITIQEPPRDPKGKKRAVPETNSDEETAIATSSSTNTSNKRSRTTSAYSLRSRTDITLSQPLEMPKKTRTTSAKGKIVGAKSKLLAAGTSRPEEEAVDVMDDHFDSDHEEAVVQEGADDIEQHEHSNGHHEEGDDDEGGDDIGGNDLRSGVGGTGSLEESAAMAIFGDYRQLGSYMMGLSSRLKSLLNNIKPTADPTTRLVSLQELSELLSISTEDTLAGSFPVESYVRELVKILGGTGADEDDDGDDEHHDSDEDASLAAALALSAGGGTYQGDENLEAQVLACRCLANLMEALPGVAHTVVYHGAIPVLCSKLVDISYIDLAEQTLSTLEKISEEFPSSIVREGGLAALLNYLDFFSIAVQRIALQAASNCCRNISPEHFPMVRNVWPIVRNCLGYSDQRLVEFACLCVIRVIDSYHRASVENLESLVDTDLIRAVILLLFPAGGSPLIAPNTYTLLLRTLAVSARASPKITMTLLEADIVDTLYQILTGVLPPDTEGQGQGDSNSGQGLGGGLTDMTVMQNLAHRPKDQIEEALSLISELMPPLPKDGVFDHKGYTEKALNRMIKAKAKADRVAARAAHKEAKEAIPMTSTPPVLPSMADIPAPDAEDTSMLVDTAPVEIHVNEAAGAKEQSLDRIELFRSNREVVGRFMQLMVPVLIDVYAASVVTPVRLKTLTGLLKAVGFLEGADLKSIFTHVPVASFSSSVLSSKDHPTLVLGALQLVEILLSKIPADYIPAFRREGVFHEIETIASRPLFSKSKDKDAHKDGRDDKDTSAPQTPEPSSPPHPPSAPFATSTPGYKKLTSLALEPEDAITLRARVIRFRHLTSGDQLDDGLYSTMQELVEKLSNPLTVEKDMLDALKAIANLFSTPDTSVSSFELLQSGVVDALLDFTTSESRSATIQQRQDLLLEAFTTRKIKGLINSPTPFAIFVKKLQESLTRMEPFEVVTVVQGIDDSRRSSPSLLARQLRLRLVAADDSDIPKSLNNIVVSIHAIATFQALHDYLQPRVSGLLSSSSRLSTMLAALTGSSLTPPASSSRSIEPAVPAESKNNPTSSGMSAPDVSRRRSLRLSAKKNASEDTEAIMEPLPTAGSSIATSSGEDPSLPAPLSESSKSQISNTEVASETLVNEAEFAAEFTDDEIDADVFEDEMDGDRSVTEKTVTLAIAGDGSKVEAQTPDGTRVVTPNSLRETLSVPSPRGVASARTSYAAALKSKPSDWHLEFSMDDHVLPLDLTIYGAIHQHEARKNLGAAVPSNLIWQGVYTVKFKKVTGPVPPEFRSENGELSSRSRSPAPTSSSLPEDASHAKILRLLRVLHHINSIQSERDSLTNDRQSVVEAAFVNNKLTAKLARQLEEPMIVASSCLPDWALDLPQHFPFLFPFSTRYNFLQSTSFGYARLILKWQSQQTRGQDTSRRDDGVGFLGRLQRQKVRISRKHIFESAVKVFELYGSSSSILEVEYFEEVGTGLGPTLEFYSLVSKEFARRDLKIWRDADLSKPGVHVHHPSGLFPAPVSPEDILTENGQKRIHIFRVIGQFIAKAMLDSRIIDVSLNKVFLKLVLGEEVPLTLDSLKLVDPDLAVSLEKVQRLAQAKCINRVPYKLGVIEHVDVADLALDFTMPGYDIELKAGGRDIPVTSNNATEYIEAVIEAILGKGAQAQAKAVREGFSKVFPISDLRSFTVDELVMLFGNSEEDWSVDTLSEVLKADHGFTGDSRAIHYLVEIMSEYDMTSRRNYLQFITGSPKLPIGGFRGLNPALTVVRKPHEPPLVADDYLPSVMTCVNYLKLPDYSSKDVMRQKLKIAMQEGVGSFHLS